MYIFKIQYACYQKNNISNNKNFHPSFNALSALQ